MIRNVLVVGQTPPPMNGQNVMIREFITGEYERIRLHHVRMSFSRQTDEVGLFNIRKIFVLVALLVRIVEARVRTKSEILYYPPAGAKLVPVIRDMFLLISTRWMFRSTVFHFHAAGLTEIYPRLPWILKPLYRLAYRKPDLAICSTETTSSIAAELEAKAVKIVPLGIQDPARGRMAADHYESPHVPKILFMGILCEGKGLLNLIDACAQLRKEGLAFEVTCAGAFESKAFRNVAEEAIEREGLSHAFTFPGVVQGEQKQRIFEGSDIFCFPSHYHAESFGVVLIEAMGYGLPIVTTRWRGIPEVVGASGGAFVVEPRRPDLLAESLGTLIRERELRALMGKKNRAYFLEHYTLEKFRAAMETALLSI